MLLTLQSWLAPRWVLGNVIASNCILLFVLSAQTGNISFPARHRVRALCNVCLQRVKRRDHTEQGQYEPSRFRLSLVGKPLAGAGERTTLDKRSTYPALQCSCRHSKFRELWSGKHSAVSPRIEPRHRAAIVLQSTDATSWWRSHTGYMLNRWARCSSMLLTLSLTCRFRLSPCNRLLFVSYMLETSMTTSWKVVSTMNTEHWAEHCYTD